MCKKTRLLARRAPNHNSRNLMKSNKTWLPLAILAAALVLWAILFAVGAYLEIGVDQPRHDLRKPLIILACMAGFLVFWGLALWFRSRRKPPRPE
jgi:membrane protein DedA with SNARE-associated domain